MNNTIRITKEFKFETGHALYGYDGLCKNVHGHSYKLAVTIIGQPISEAKHVKLGMVMDFGDLKKIVEEGIVNIINKKCENLQTLHGVEYTRLDEAP